MPEKGKKCHRWVKECQRRGKGCQRREKEGQRRWEKNARDDGKLISEKNERNAREGEWDAGELVARE